MAADVTAGDGMAGGMAGDGMAGDRTAGDGMAGNLAVGQELSCPFAPPAAPGSPPRPKRGYLLPGTIALVVCAAIATVIDLAGLQSHAPPSLAGRQVEAFISQSLQYVHPQATPPQVRCPSDEPLRSGFTFDCVLIKGGRTAGTIHVTETSADGTFRFQPPTG